MNSLSLEHLVEDYIAEHILRPASQVNYSKIAQIWISDTKRTLVSEVNAKHVREWRATILSRASATTWNSYRRHLRALWNYAMRRNVCRANPFSDTAAAPAPKGRKKTVSRADLNRVANTLQCGGFSRVQPAWFWVIVIKTFFYTGIRRRQLTELRWSDIQFGDQSILLRSTTSKTYNEWTIPITEALVPELENLHLTTTTTLNRPPSGDEQVFNVTRFDSRYVGQEMTVEQVSAAFRRISKAIGVRISPHRLRHSLATAAAPKDARALQELLGHSNIHTTMQYVHPDLERMRALLDQIVF